MLVATLFKIVRISGELWKSMPYLHAEAWAEERDVCRGQVGKFDRGYHLSWSTVPWESFSYDWKLNTEPIVELPWIQFLVTTARHRVNHLASPHWRSESDQAIGDDVAVQKPAAKPADGEFEIPRYNPNQSYQTADGPQKLIAKLLIPFFPFFPFFPKKAYFISGQKYWNWYFSMSYRSKASFMGCRWSEVQILSPRPVKTKG